jgi:uncharacterized membrane protein YdjX (TVP38/TMEM64 family)
MPNDSNRHTRKSWTLVVCVLLALAALIFFGSNLHERFGSYFSMEGIETTREWIAGLGWRGPFVFVALVAFRHFLFLSSQIVLILGGLVFGFFGGALWGGLGLVLCAVGQYWAARASGENFGRGRLTGRQAIFLTQVRQAGPIPVFLAAAYPLGPMTAISIASGAVNLAVWKFTFAVSAGSFVRAALYAVLGESILHLSLTDLMGWGLLVTICLLSPLLVPSVRRWLKSSLMLPQDRGGRSLVPPSVKGPD